MTFSQYRFRLQSKSIAEELTSEPYAFDFYQALRILERLRINSAMPAESTRFNYETVRFSAYTSKSFPPSVIVGIEHLNTSPNRDSLGLTSPPTLIVSHLGLAGAHGVLPEFVTDEILRQLKTGESPLQDFLDIFNHRLIVLHARVRRIYRPTYINVTPEQSPLATVFYALMGLGIDSVRNKMCIDDGELIPFTGLLAGPHRSQASIQVMLSEFIGCPVQIIPFRASWVPLDERVTTCIGTQGRNAVLGQNAICGRRAFHPTDGCTVCIGPCSFERFCALKPGGDDHPKLQDVVRLLFHDTTTVEIRLELDSNAVPTSQLGRTTQLGYTSWLNPQRYLKAPSRHPHRFTMIALRYRWNTTTSSFVEHS